MIFPKSDGKFLTLLPRQNDSPRSACLQNLGRPSSSYDSHENERKQILMKWLNLMGALAIVIASNGTAQAGLFGGHGHGSNCCGAAKSCGCGLECPRICCKPVICRPTCHKVFNYQRSCCKPSCCDTCAPSNCCAPKDCCAPAAKDCCAPAAKDCCAPAAKIAAALPRLPTIVVHRLPKDAADLRPAVPRCPAANLA